ncbi:unnamed protein product [Dibothriocephalus latus]|uniref:Uncharacterized protein n=1 Tax=Dibothriocephalus latus TaxID=60516 RepID=A0A3P7PJ65_DIBLA|nr:unnamed protein product [Dibothriocephalus latus]
MEKHLKVKVNTQLSDLELAPDDISLSIPTTSVPSVAKVRYSVVASTSSHSPPLSGLSSLFNRKKAADTDAYELFPNCDNYVLCALFAEPRSKLEHLEEEDPLAGSVTLEDFFNQSLEFEFSEHPDDGHQSVVEMDGGEDEETAEEEGDEEESISGESPSSCNSSSRQITAEA